MMRHLFDCWEPFAARAAAADHILLLSDYDGTLTRIVGRPEQAFMPDDVRALLTEIARKPSFSVGIISGRALNDVRNLAGIEGIYYAGNHGLEIDGPGFKFTNPAAPASRTHLTELKLRLGSLLGGIEGVLIEDKGLSLSVHYRLVPEAERGRVEGLFRQAIEPLLLKSRIRTTAGKMVWDILPRIDWHKGRAVQTIAGAIRTRFRAKDLLIVYLGDDVTDEDAFKVLRQPEGWGIFVGKDSSVAEFCLDSPDEVRAFLDRLARLR
ncbi:MAG: trehalose-phosphatase [Chloroflexi bacterium]|nr:trehalose-phosphatase [Chloroflexota bacterium]